MPVFKSFYELIRGISNWTVSLMIKLIFIMPSAILVRGVALLHNATPRLLIINKFEAKHAKIGDFRCPENSLNFHEFSGRTNFRRD